MTGRFPEVLVFVQLFGSAQLSREGLAVTRIISFTITQYVIEKCRDGAGVRFMRHCGPKDRALFVPDSLHGVEARCFDRRVDAKDQPNRDGDQEGQQDRAESDDGGPTREPRDESRHSEPEEEPHRSAHEGYQDRLDQELPDDVPLTRSDGAPDSNLARALEDAGQHDVHDPDAAHQKRDGGDGDHHRAEKALGASLLGQQFGGHDHAEVARAAMRGIQDPAHDVRRVNAVRGRVEAQVDAVNLVPRIAVGVFQAVDGGVQGNVDETIEVLDGDSRDLGWGTYLRPDDANHVEPLLIDFQILARGFGSEQAGPRALAQHADRRGPGILVRIEESSLDDSEPGNLLVFRVEAVKHRDRLVRFGDEFRGREAFSRRRGHGAADICADHAIVLKGQPGRELANLLVRLPFEGFLSFYDQVPHAQLFDERHHLLLRPGADRKHRDHGCDTENHPQHGEQGPELVEQQVFEAQAKVGQELTVTPAAGRWRESGGLDPRRHREPPAAAGTSGPAGLGGPLPRFSGFTSATSVPSFRPAMATELSVISLTLTSCSSKLSPFLTKTMGLPFFSNSAWRGR